MHSVLSLYIFLSGNSPEITVKSGHLGFHPQKVMINRLKHTQVTSLGEDLFI